MKKNYYIVFLLISIACIAQKQEQGCLTVKAELETVKYNFDSIKDLEENMDSLLNEIDNTNDGLVNLTIEIQLKIKDQEVSTELLASSTGPKKTITAAVKKLCHALLTGVSQ